MGEITSPNGYVYYYYIPSQPGAIVVCVLFAIGTLAVAFRSISTRTWFAIPFIVGGIRKSSYLIQHPEAWLMTAIVEVVGYVGRAIAKNDESSPLIPFILQSVLLLIAPALFAASIYMTLGRVIRSVHGEHHSLIRVDWLTRLFVLSDVVSFFAQAAGGGLQAGKHFNKNTAKYIVLGGLIIQIVGFGLFTVTSLFWHLRMRRQPTRASEADIARRWEKIVFMLYSVSVLILIRSVFRVIEYAMGSSGYLLSHEWPLYIFDATLMMIVVAIFAWWYPGRLDVSSIGKADVESSPDPTYTMKDRPLPQSTWGA